MADFNVRADAVNVEQIMEQIRTRIREKRGVDYTDEQVRELARVKLEKFLDPRSVRSDLLEQYQRTQQTSPPNYAFGEDTLFDSHRGPLRWIRKVLRPVLKLFFNPNPLIQALHIQSQLNTMFAERENRLHLQYEVLHNLVVEMTRSSIELKNLKMRVESLASRLEFTERRARALEGLVMYKPTAEERYVPASPPPSQPPAAHDGEGPAATAARSDASGASGPSPGAGGAEGPGQRSRRRRRRRGRRSGAPAAAVMGGDAQGTSSPDAGDIGSSDSDNDDTVDDQHDADAPRLEPSSALESSSGLPPRTDLARGLERSDSPETLEVAPGASEPDRRVVRPEPIEQASGTAAHPAEPVTNDPDDQQ